jgi:hypothetical protein
MTIIVDSFLSVDQLIQLHNMGFKLIPLGADGKTPAIKSTNEVYHNPNYWTNEKIIQESSKFRNVATTFGKTHLDDPEGKDLYLNEIDIDSKEVFDRLAVLKVRDKEHFFLGDMCKLTFVVKTRKKWGRRIFWLSHKQYSPVRTRDCKPGCEFEIKTDNTLGHSTLPPSRHRDNEEFHYQSIGQETIAIQDGLYDGMFKLLFDCLDKKPHDRKNIIMRTTAAVANVDIILAQGDIEEIISQIKAHYQKGKRQNITLGLSGLLYKGGVVLESAEKLVVALCNATSDEEKVSRVAALRNTYTKGQRGEEIRGASLLSDVLTDGEVANDLLNNITSVWNKYKNPILAQLQDHIRHELQPHVVEVLCYTPLEFVVAHSHKKQILYAKIEHRSREHNDLL